MTATILPLAKTSFFDSNGRPLAGGSVYFYVPQTSTFKNTWQDSGQTVLNTNPVILDSNGQAIIYGNGQYRQVVYDIHNNLIWDQLTSSPSSQADLSSTTDATNGAGAIGFNYSLSYAAGTVGKWLKDLANSTGSSFIGFIQAGSQAVVRTVQDKARERVSVEDFYISSMGNDWTLAFQRAVSALSAGGVVEYNTPGTVNISATIVTSDSAPIVFKGKGSATIIQKAFNGDMFNLGKKSELRDLKIDGNGASYTGRGIICTTGAVDLVSWRRIDNVEMINMNGYPVEFVGAYAGYGSVISRSYLGAVDGTTAGVKLPDSEPNGNRQMINVYTSGPLFNAAGCNNHYAQGCEGAAPILSSSSVKVRMNSCRIPFSVSTPTFDVDGVDTLVADCEIGVTAINFKSTLSSCNWYGNDDIGAAPTITDLSNGTNRIQIKRTLYTPTWASSGTSITPGNASLGGAWTREGDRCKATGTLSIGSTTVVTGSTTWTMTMPYKAARNQTGSVWIQQSSGGLKQYAGSCVITAGTSLVQFNPAGVTSAVGAGVPGTWVANDLLIWDIDYFIQ